MKMTVIDHVWDPDSSSNADWFHVCEDLVILLDGAAPQHSVCVSDHENDAVWLVRRFVELLCAFRDTRPEPSRVVDLIEATRLLLREEYAAMSRDRQLTPVEKPFSCLGVARTIGDYVEFLNMGDLTLLIRARDGHVQHFGNNAVKQLDRTALSLLSSEVAAGTEPHAARVDAVWPAIQSNRARRNVMPGYEVLDLDASCHDGFERVLWNRHELDGFLWMSDGFYRLVDTYERYVDASLYAAATEARGLHALLAELRSIEDGDPECVRAPRFKCKDDATALLVRCR